MESLKLFLFIYSLIFSYVTLKHYKLAIKLIIFNISFLIPFQTSYLPVGLPGLQIILFIILTIFIRNNKGIKLSSLTSKSKAFILLYYFLVIGLLIGLYYTAIDIDFTDAGFSNLTQVIYFSLNLIVIILFVKILFSIEHDFLFYRSLIKIFCFSILVHAIAFSIFANTSIAPILFYNAESDSANLNTEIVRFNSLIGDYELTIDYILITIGFSLSLYLREKKIVNLVLILIAVWLGLMTGTRSFVVVGGIFFISFVLFCIRGAKIKFAFFIVSIIVFYLLSTSIFASQIFNNNPLIIRLSQTIEELKGNKVSVSQLANRDFGSATEELLNHTGFFGNGAFTFNKFNNNEMVSHNIFLAVYAKYGIVGLLVLVWLLRKLIIRLIKTIANSSNIVVRREATLFLLLLICLILQELKISAIRNISVLLIYTFFFFSIYCLHKESILQKWKNH